uniref:AMP-dependent synthetase/ligase domain-containing protein n=1 Tax=Timema poppense TaxID=170557 RepID=A0A7R9DFF0_TIMPO|nr:unnamed protein product [Timema poppensis]
MVYGRGRKHFRVGPRTYFARHIPQVDADSGAELTYCEVRERSTRLSQVLAARGVDVGDCVMVCSENCLHYCWVLLGILKARACCHLVNHHSSAQLVASPTSMESVRYSFMKSLNSPQDLHKENLFSLYGRKAFRTHGRLRLDCFERSRAAVARTVDGRRERPPTVRSLSISLSSRSDPLMFIFHFASLSLNSILHPYSPNLLLLSLNC